MINPDFIWVALTPDLPNGQIKTLVNKKGQKEITRKDQVELKK